MKQNPVAHPRLHSHPGLPRREEAELALLLVLLRLLRLLRLLLLALLLLLLLLLLELWLLDPELEDDEEETLDSDPAGEAGRGGAAAAPFEKMACNGKEKQEGKENERQEEKEHERQEGKEHERQEGKEQGALWVAKYRE